MTPGSRIGGKALRILKKGVWIRPRFDLYSLGVEKNLSLSERIKGIRIQSLGRLFGLQEVKAPRSSSKKSVNEDDNIVSPTHRPSLPPRDTLVLMSTPGRQRGRKDYVNE